MVQPLVETSNQALILIINPIQALWFIIFILCLQQFENNIIYPRVVGNSVGLSAIWVMLAMLVGGSTLGLLGMLIGIPLFSVAYQLIKEKDFPVIRVSERRLIIPVKSLEKWLEEKAERAW